MTDPIDRVKVEETLMRVSAPQAGRSPLADVLRSPNFNPAERDAIVRGVVADGRSGAVFLAADFVRSQAGEAGMQALQADQRTIGEALQRVYADPATDRGRFGQDLVRIASTSPQVHGAHRFLNVVRNGGEGADGTVAALTDGLWARNQPGSDDRAVAAIGILGDPALRATRFGMPEPSGGATPEQVQARREAFEALVGYTDRLGTTELGRGLSEQTRDQLRGQSVAAATELFAAHGHELIDRATGARNTETLAKFFNQSMFSPDTRGVRMADGRTVSEVAAGTLNTVASGYLDAARAHPDRSEAQLAEMTKLGRLSASVEGGINLALNQYSDRLTANEQERRAFASAVGTVVGLVPVPGGKIVGVGVKLGTDAAGNALAGFVHSAPQRPDLTLGSAVSDSLEAQAYGVGQLAGGAFNAAYTKELGDLQRTDRMGRLLPDGRRAEAAVPGSGDGVSLAGLSTGEAFDRLVTARREGPEALDRTVAALPGSGVNEALFQEAALRADRREAEQGQQPQVPVVDEAAEKIRHAPRAIG